MRTNNMISSLLMLIAPVLVAAAIRTPSASMTSLTPEISLGMSTSSIAGESKLGGLEPMLKWTARGAVSDVDVEGGISVAVQDVNRLPFSLYGRARKFVSGWNLSAKFDSHSDDLKTWGVDLLASTGITSLQVTGQLSGGSSAESVENNNRKADGKMGYVKLTHSLAGVADTVWTIAPGYNAQTNTPDLSVACGYDRTIVAVDATPDVQKFSLSQTFRDNIITPSVTTEGAFEVEYRRLLASGGSVAAAVQPNVENGLLAVEWVDGPWSASASAPLNELTDVSVNIRRRVDTF